MKRRGRKSAAQTPAPKKERVYGSAKNPVGSAASKTSASKIQLSDAIVKTLEKKRDDFNEKHPTKKVSLATLMAVMRRGMGAYSKSHRPTITGGAPNSRQAWGFARVNKFLKKYAGEQVKAAYVQDDDLLEKGGQLYHLGGDMSKHLAPNGKPSNLTHEQWHLVRTPEFKAWFGDWENDPENASKVVDDNGEPLVVYRGVPKSLENKYKFDFDTQLLTAYKRVNKFGFYFTSDYEFANSYAKNYAYPEQGVVISYFLNIRRLIKIKGKNETQITQIELLDLLGLKNKYIQEYELSDAQVEDMNRDGSHFSQKRSIHGFFVQYKGYKKPFSSFLKKNILKKYDGILFYENWANINSDNYVCFEPNQIKLADGTNTTFDTQNPDIRYKDGGMTKINLPDTESIYESLQTVLAAQGYELKRVMKPTKSVEQIAEEHDATVDFIEQQLEIGTEHEMEHTYSTEVARQTALHHLAEDPEYYINLKDMEMRREAEKLEGYYKTGGALKGETTCEVLDKKGERLIDEYAILNMTLCLNDLPQTKSMHFDYETNDYTPERKKLHRDIIYNFKKDLVCVEREQPIAILMGGSPASGKSTFLKKFAPYLLKEEIFKVDADEIRAKLPEYRGYNATQTHLETKDIVNTLLSDRNIGIPCRFDIIYDGTMNNTKSYLPLITLLKREGYKVFIVYIDKVPKDVIVKRALERYKKSGRFVPLEVIDDFFEKGTAAMEQLKPQVDGYMIIDGSNTDYKIIERGGEELPQDRNYSKIGQPIKITTEDVVRELKDGGEIDYENITHKDLVINEEDIKSGLYVIDKKSFSSGKLMLVDKDNRKANFVNHSKTRPRKFGILRNLSFDNIKDGFYKDLRRSLAEKVVGYDYEKNKWVSDEKNYKRGGEIDADDPKIKDAMTHKAGAAGGLLVGNRHSEGGIKAVNKSTGQPLEMEGGEVVITRDAVSDDTKREFEGEMLTNREILSRINESGGGVSFADGGDIPERCACRGKEYKFGGKMMKDNEIVENIMTSYRKLFGVQYPELKTSEAMNKIFAHRLKFEAGGQIYGEGGTLTFVNRKLPTFNAFQKLNKDSILPQGMKRAYKEYLNKKYFVKFEELPHVLQAALLMGNQKLVDSYINS